MAERKILDGAIRGMADLMLRSPACEWAVLRTLRSLRQSVFARGIWWRLRAELCRRTAGRPDGYRWVRLDSGPELLVHMADLLGVLFLDGEPYEPLTTRFVLDALKPGDTFLDVGANFGYFSLLAAGCVQPNGRVCAFEANPELRDCLKQSVRRNHLEDTVVLGDVALSDSDQEAVPFYISNDPANAGISTMFPWIEHLKAGNLTEARKIAICTRRFDAWVERHPLDRIDMVKLDVEGAELNVLRGMIQTLKRYRPRFIICESSIKGPVTDFLGALGYSAEALELHVPQDQWGNILYTLQDQA